MDNTPNESVSQNESTTQTPTNSNDPKKFDAEYVERLRNEAAAERKAKAALEAERAELLKYKEERERADLEKEKRFEELAAKERERAEKLVQDHQRQLEAFNARLIRTELKAKAIAAGILDPDDVKAMDLDGVEVDDEGEVIGVDDVIAAYREKKPHWFRATETDEPNTEAKPKPKAPAPVAPSKRETPTIDWASLSPEEYKKQRERLLKP